MSRRIRVAVLTVSDRSHLGLREDRTGPVITRWVERQAWEVMGAEILPDEPALVAKQLCRWADEADADLILTTGGTGLSPRDRVPEATLAVIERPIPGIPEWIRTATAAAHPHAVLSRGIAGLRGGTLIVNLPGSERAVAEYLDRLGLILPHALAQVRQGTNWGPADSHPESPRDGGEIGWTGS